MQYELIRIKTILTEGEGQLSFFEGERSFPFPIRRVYYISNVPAGVKRGGHAHKTLKQILFCPYGSITIILSNGREREEIVLDDPGKGLVLYPGLWREMVWNVENSALCVAASQYYDESDYIRDYDEYLAYLRESDQ